MSIFNFTNGHNANKRLSIYTSIITFLLGCTWVIFNLIIDKRVINREEAIAIVIILLGLNAISMGSDLRGFIKLMRNSSKIDEDK